MSAQAFSKDSQNPYKTGVLVGNHIEDRFGRELSSKPKNYQPITTEQRSKFHLGNTLLAYEFPPKSLDDILAEKEKKEYEDHMKEIQRGTKTHLFFGHGATQDDFVKRDFGTSNNLFYDKRMKTEELINPHYYHNEPPKADASQTVASNSQNSDPLSNLGSSYSGGFGKTVPKAYSEFTKKFDNNYQKMGLRR
ncbi:UNKNOWN [Stylonychia lemnae]|uniref:Uncharacterized protein n=1 Tax=Stylonychia lemnae TaxID=5949 RepID=A0A078AUS3_STYLE|nr:UNKNOWN [Stylonychia lemnae]|eukprot:CDW84628.1 UNKNOWN [Stylonychia lemnae]